MPGAGPFGSGAFGTGVYAPSPLFTSKGIIDAVLRDTGHTSVTTVPEKRKSVLGFINNRYATVASHKHWSWLFSSVDFNLIAPYTTGTVSVAKGSHTVTGVLTDWTSTDLVPLKRITITNGKDEIYNIASLTSAYELELETKYSSNDAVDVSYQITQGVYALPSDVNELRSVTIDGGTARPLQLVGTQEMARMKARFTSYTGMPQYATIVARNLDGTVHMEVWPVPSEAYNIHIDYSVNIVKLLDTDTSWPLIPDRYRQVLYYGALAEMYRLLRRPAESQTAEADFDKILRRLETDTQLTDSRVQIMPTRQMGRRRYNPMTVAWRASDFGRYDD